MEKSMKKEIFCCCRRLGDLLSGCWVILTSFYLRRIGNDPQWRWSASCNWLLYLWANRGQLMKPLLIHSVVGWGRCCCGGNGTCRSRRSCNEGDVTIVLMKLLFLLCCIRRYIWSWWWWIDGNRICWGGKFKN